MAKHVFLSFVEEDLDLVWMFRGQARNKNLSLAFDDYSVKTPYNSTDAAYIKGQIRPLIRAASITVCLIGTATHMSSWVDWEIEYAAEQGKRLAGIRLHSSRKGERVPAALTRNRAMILNWDIDEIVRWIG
ncbi:TIR domain-containing protein [Micromonospora mangrovi]|uniref:TIR domain-containing protein n=2 Tax=Micromonospora TaxID=1873 RepID=A0AAU8HFX1_9ACTN